MINPKIIIILFLSFCSQIIVAQQNINSEILSNPVNKKRALKYHLIDAKRYLSIGNLNKAIECYEKCLTLSPNDATTHYELTNIALALNKTKEALQISREAVKEAPKNISILKQHIEVLKARGLWMKVASIYDQIIAIEPNREYFEAKLRTCNRIEDWEGAIKVYSDIQKHFGNDFHTIIGKQALYSKVNRQDEAITELNELIKKEPKNGDLLAILGLRYEENNAPQKAESIYNKLEKLKNKGKVGIIILADYYVSKKSFDKAYRLLAKALTEKGTLPKMTIISVVQFEKESRKTNYNKENKHLAYLLTQAYPKDIRGHLILAKYLKEERDYISAERVLIDALEIDSLNIEAMQRLTYIYEKLEKREALLNITKQGIIAYPNNCIFYIYKGVAEKEMKLYEDAIRDFQTAIIYAKSPKQKMIMKDILAQLYFEIGQTEKSYKIYEDYLQTDPENLDILNNYSYMLADEKKDFKKAETMILKCIKKAPNEPDFLDTYSWILFKQKKNKKALQLVKQTLLKNKNKELSADVLEHSGDIFWANKNKRKAVDLWKQALQVATKKKKILIKKKIKNGIE